MNDAGRQAASLLARVWNPAGGPVPVPVDPVFIAKQLGMEVFAADLGEGTAGMLVKKAGQDPAIYLNSGDSPNRRRFTCAHEVGHYIQRVDRGDDRTWEFVDRRNHLSSRGTHPDEIYANQFAAQLLMPEDEVREVADSRTPADLAALFRVSLEAMTHRLDALGLSRSLRRPSSR